VVEPAEADVVGPAVAADDPDRLAHERVGERVEALRRRPVRAGHAVQPRPELRDPGPLFGQRGLGVLRGGEQCGREVVADLARELHDSACAVVTCCSSAMRIPSPNSALSSNSEFDHAGPRPSRFGASTGVVGRFPP
jgi:hypothetical protein